MSGQISMFDFLRSCPDINPYTLANESGTVKLNFVKDGDGVIVEMTFNDTGQWMACRTSVQDIKEVVSNL